LTDGRRLPNARRAMSDYETSLRLHDGIGQALGVGRQNWTRRLLESGWNWEKSGFSMYVEQRQDVRAD
jgi:hypothetical protein